MLRDAATPRACAPIRLRLIIAAPLPYQPHDAAYLQRAAAMLPHAATAMMRADVLIRRGAG